MNSNLLVLIPKLAIATLVSDFRPIALANFIFKIITKIIVARVALIATKVIINNQNGFVQGRDISETSEAINLLNKYRLLVR